MIDRQLSFGHFIKIKPDFIELLEQTFETHQLIGDTLRQRSSRHIFDVTAKQE